jgi:hypothetical protein
MHGVRPPHWISIGSGGGWADFFLRGGSLVRTLRDSRTRSACHGAWKRSSTECQGGGKERGVGGMGKVLPRNTDGGHVSVLRAFFSILEFGWKYRHWT